VVAVVLFVMGLLQHHCRRNQYSTSVIITSSSLLFQI